jgi:hypothetical protein
VPGSRRFSFNEATSGVATYVSPDELASSTTGFRGFLDLAMGTPDANGIARLALVGSSEFLSLPLGDSTLCFRPFLQQFNVGVIACNGGIDLGVRTTQDHRIGVVGVSGFTAAACAAASGTVEGPADPHPGVCNGPVSVTLSGEGNSGAGAVLIAPDGRFSPATTGLLGQISVQPGPCDTHQGSQQAVLGFVSSLYRVDILDADAIPGATLRHDARGEAFSCAQFTQENGPGRLVLGVGALHGAGGLDVVTVFDLDD